MSTKTGKYKFDSVKLVKPVAVELDNVRDEEICISKRSIPGILRDIANRPGKAVLRDNTRLVPEMYSQYSNGAEYLEDNVEMTRENITARVSLGFFENSEWNSVRNMFVVEDTEEDEVTLDSGQTVSLPYITAITAYNPPEEDDTVIEATYHHPEDVVKNKDLF